MFNNTKSIMEEILQEFEKYKGQLVICSSWYIQRLIAIGDDTEDYYWILWNGRETIWESCVGKFVPLKGFIPDEDYDEFKRISIL